jgi:sugar phosphate permease
MTSPADADRPTLPAATVLRIFVPFAFAYALSYLYRVVNAVIAPDLAAEIDLTAADLGMMTSAYFLCFAAFQLPLGILLDRYGPRRTEAFLLVVAAVGALVFAQAETVTGLVIGRGLIGLGVSAGLMAALTAYARWFPPERLAFVNGLQAAAGGIGAVVVCGLWLSVGGACKATTSGVGAVGGATNTVALRSALQEIPSNAAVTASARPWRAPVNHFIRKEKTRQAGA